MWDEITYPFPNFKGGTVEVWDWIRNFIPHFIGHVIAYHTLITVGVVAPCYALRHVLMFRPSVISSVLQSRAPLVHLRSPSGQWNLYHRFREVSEACTKLVGSFIFVRVYTESLKLLQEYMFKCSYPFDVPHSAGGSTALLPRFMPYFRAIENSR